MRDHFIKNLTGLGYPISTILGENAGLDILNVCNKSQSGMGVQFEISNGFRSKLFTNWRTRKGRHEPTELFTKFISDIRRLII